MSSTEPAPPRKGTKRERTRTVLVAATLAIVEQQGFAAASLEAIAAKAGMTKGAIYSNFASKAELLLAAMIARGFALSAPRPPASSVREELSAVASELSAMLARAQADAALLADFQLQALADPELRKGLGAVYSDSFSGTAAYLARLSDLPPAMPPRHLAVALQAIALGFLLQSQVTPDEITEAVVRETFEALAAGLSG